MKRCLLFAAILGVFPQTAFADLDSEDAHEGEAQAALSIKLVDLISFAVKASPILSKARVDRTIAIGTAGATQSEQAWVVTLKGNASRSAVADRIEVDPMAQVAQDKLNADLTIQRTLPNGARLGVEVSIEHSRTEYNITAFNGFLTGASALGGMQPTMDQFEFQLGNVFTTKATFTQPLLRGMGSTVALAKQHKAELDVLSSTVKAQQAAEETVNDLISSYWELAYTSYEVDIRAESLDLAQKQADKTRVEMRLQAIERTAMNSVNYELAVRREALVRAQIDLENKSLELRRKAGLELSQREILLRPSDELEVGNDVADTNAAIARSRKWNRKSAVIALERKVADIDVEVTDNATLPQLDVGVSGALIGYGGGPEDTQGTTGIGDAIGGLSSGFEVMGNVTISLEIGGGAKSAHEAALARRHKLDIERADLERTTDTQVVAATHAINGAKERVDLADQSILMAHDNLTAELGMYVAGKGENQKILQKQTQVIEARLRRGRAVADYHIAVAKLRMLNGTLLAQYQIDVRPPEAR